MNMSHNHTNKQLITTMRTAISDVSAFQNISEVFKVLGDSNRLRLFWLLCHVEECVIDIAELLQMSSPAVSHHLKVLKESGLVISRRDGKEVYYKASDSSYRLLLDQTVENIIDISCPNLNSEFANNDSKQKNIVREIHDYLMEHLDERITIEQLSKDYHINMTSLKTLFKAEYGVSLATHMNVHRMEKAAALLRNTNDSIHSISHQVGYENQSKFSTSFKKYYHQTPLKYRVEGK